MVYLNMLQRSFFVETIRKALKRSRIVALVGPRQCGKTTLARHLSDKNPENYFDLEDPVSQARLAAPMLALAPLKGLVIIDEIQLSPDLYPILRVLADRTPNPARFLILGSASPALIQKSSESLAGRLEMIELTPFSTNEIFVKKDLQKKHWLRGGFPLSLLAKTEADSSVWRKNFVRTFIERDVPMMGLGATPALLGRFWHMLAHYHGNIWNAAEMGRSLGINETTARRYLDLLSGTFMVRQLKPYHANLGKRQVKSPKIYFRDTGLFHTLIGIEGSRELQTHPKIGASYEGYAVEELLRLKQYTEAYFWATHTGAELDLLLLYKGSRYGYEIKYTDAPKLTPSMRIAMEDLKLDSLRVVYPGPRRYALAQNIEAIPLADALIM